MPQIVFFFFSSRRRHTRYIGDWSSDVCSSDLLLITESSIVNDNRNRGKSRDQIEGELIETLGVEKVVWLAGVRGKDITDRSEERRVGKECRCEWSCDVCK